jgi:hypothetical protein
MPEEPMWKRTSFILPPTLWRQFKQVCEYRNLKSGETLRQLVKRFVEENREVPE